MKLINRQALMPRDIEDQIRADAVARYPEESIGCISKGKYIAFKNVAEKPRLMALPEREKYQNMLIDGEIEAMVHSHPDAPFCPSKADMISQIEMAIPCGLVGVYNGACTRVALWGDQLERMDLIKRPFQHGISDCYEAIRDHYFVKKNILMKQFPRDWEWWTPKNSENMYLDFFETAGFYKVDPEDAKPDDVILFKIRSEKHNHAGVFLGNYGFYHHPTYREPFMKTYHARIENITRWLKYDPIFVRANLDHPAIRYV